MPEGMARIGALAAEIDEFSCAACAVSRGDASTVIADPCRAHGDHRQPEARIGSLCLREMGGDRGGGAVVGLRKADIGGRRDPAEAFKWMREPFGFRETGEGRSKVQFLIETMFCVYYLSKGSAFRASARTSNLTKFC